MNAQEPIASGLESLSEFGKESASTASVAFSDWFGHYGRMQQEAIHFMRDRLLKDFEALSQFALCKKPEELLQLQAKFVSEMFSDYVAAGGKAIASLGGALPNATSKTRAPIAASNKPARSRG